MGYITLRPEVQWFAEQMERKLRENDWKGGWQVDSYQSLCQRLKEEGSELEQLIPSVLKDSPSHVIGEAADVANFAMMIADNAKNLRHPIIKGFHPTHSI